MTFIIIQPRNTIPKKFEFIIKSRLSIKSSKMLCITVFLIVVLAKIFTSESLSCAENEQREFARKQPLIQNYISCRGYPQNLLEDTIVTYLSQCSKTIYETDEFMMCHHQCFINNNCLGFLFEEEICELYLISEIGNAEVNDNVFFDMIALENITGMHAVFFCLKKTTSNILFIMSKLY